MELALDTFPQKSTNFELTEMDGEAILYSVLSEKAIYLNSTAKMIWTLCSGQDSVADIIGTLNTQYPCSPSVETDVLASLVEMRDDGIITMLPTSA